MTTETPTRRAYHGSCHCGRTKYIAYITLPPPIISADPTLATPTSTTRIRKCNCTTCQKTANVSLRLMDSPNDFYLLSPITSPSSSPSSTEDPNTNIAFGGIDISPETGLKDYIWGDKFIHWFFCRECGVRCFNMMGEGEVRDVLVEGEMVRAWTPKREGWVEGGYGGNLSVNATSVDAGQVGWDMREWHEKGWIVYLDSLKWEGEPNIGKPHEGGMY